MLNLEQLGAIEQEVRLCFVREDAPDYLRDLEQGILGIGQAGEGNPDWAELLRAAHTLKGGAGLAQLYGIASLTHSLEDVLNALRDRRFTQPELVQDLLLRGLDDLGQLFRQVEESADPSLDPQPDAELIAAMTAIVEDAAPLEEPSAEVLSSTGGIDPLRIVLETDLAQCLGRARSALAVQPVDRAGLQEFQALSLALGEMLNVAWLVAGAGALAMLLGSADLDQPAIGQLLADLETQRVKALAPAPAATAQPLQPISVSADSDPVEPAPVSETIAAPIASETTIPAAKSSEADVTMRVPVQRLNQLADNVGDLLIGYERVNLDHDRMNSASRELKQRTRQFYRVREQLQTLYDQLLLDNNAAASPGPTVRSGDATGQSPVDSELGAFDSLEFDRFTALHSVLQTLQELLSRIEESSQDIELTRQSAQEGMRTLQRTLATMRSSLSGARMQPFASLAERFRRPLWSLNQRFGKGVLFTIEGSQTLIDRAVLESLYDPLLHLIRNAYDHGLDSVADRQAQGKSGPGTLTLRARRLGTQVQISVIDNGKGINRDRVRQIAEQRGLIRSGQVISDRQLLDCIFASGFSTASEVGELSGRGVGLDVVRADLEALRGTVQVESQLGQGTQFILSVPLTLNVVPLLWCQGRLANGSATAIAFPAEQVLDLIELPVIATSDAEDPSISQPDLIWRDRSLSRISLAQLLPQSVPVQRYRHIHDRTEAGSGLQRPIGVVLQVPGSNGHPDRWVAIEVAELLGQRELVLKPFGDLVPNPAYIAGCTILPSGDLIPVLLPEGLSELLAQPIAAPSIHRMASPIAAPIASRTLLVVDDSLTVRRWLSRSLEQLGYPVVQCRDGQEALDRLRQGLDCALVISDVEMPRLDGFGLLKAIRQGDRPSLPVALLTSRQGDRHIQMALDLGANGYFTKPLGNQQLLKHLDQLIAGETIRPAVPV
jgi:chemotaxis protein histidine kinase CheA/ActR/RegA family two-component response regulator